MLPWSYGFIMYSNKASGHHSLYQFIEDLFVVLYY